MYHAWAIFLAGEVKQTQKQAACDNLCTIGLRMDQLARACISVGPSALRCDHLSCVSHAVDLIRLN